MPLAGWKDVLKRCWTETWDDNVALVAAGVAFYGFLAFVPLLAAIVLVWGLVADLKTVVETLRTLFAVLPDDIAKLISDQLLSVVRASEDQKGIGLVIALLIAVYGASNGAGSIITALNIAYEENEKRSLWRVYLLTVIVTIGAIAGAILALAATAVLLSAEQLLPEASPTGILIGKVAAYVLMTLAGAAVAATFYRFVPSRQKAQWKWITPGSLFSALMWLLLTLAFGFYASRIANFNRTYGSLAAVAGLLTWMYLSAYAFVFGAELNSELEHQTEKDSTTGKPQPLGKRGAWAADHVAGMRDDKRAETGPSLAEAGPPNPVKESETSTS